MNKKYAAILLLAAAAVWTSGCSPQPISSQQAKPIQATKAPSAPAIKTDSKAASDEGIKKYQAGDYDKAIEDFDKALALDADNYQALSNKGVTLAMRGNATGSKQDVEQGIALIEQALQLAPKDMASFYNMALAYKIDGSVR